MASPLVETKLFIPRLRRGALPRPRLSEALHRSALAKLTLLSAPAGFGKTTALAAWLADTTTSEGRTAWLSLEEADSSAVGFWTHVTSALSTVVPGVAADALQLLSSAQPQIRTVLVTLLNELSAAPEDINLVLDDYHLVDGPEIAGDMTFVIEHLPPNVHLIISTRADPTLPLPRLRARGELVEIRAGDLRFTPAEVAHYLNGITGLDLTDTDIAILKDRTEGWIAALQLAALSLQGRDDVEEFIAGFAGDHRYVVDYLVEEVLGRQPASVRAFLTATSILDRLSGPLCDFVTGQPAGKTTLQELERSNLFVIPLDERRHWYRYHHLFADVLRTHLADEQPDDVAGLHRRASHWYEQHAQTQPAIRHALAAGDIDRAAALIEMAIPELRRRREDNTIRRWVDVIPPDIVRTRPVLAVEFVGALLSTGEFDDVEHRLDDIEKSMHTTQPTDEPAPAVADVVRGERDRLTGSIQMYRSALALSRGDTAGTRRHATMAEERAPTGDHLTRAGAAALKGLAAWGEGDLDEAYRAYTASVEGMLKVGHIADVLACSITLADLCLTQGRLRDAADTYQRALQLAGTGTEGTDPRVVLPGTADMYVGLSQVAYERDDLDAATSFLLRSQELGDRAGLPQNPYRWRLAMARVKEASGDVMGAIALLHEAERMYTGDFSPNVRPVPALRARVAAAHGDLAAALAWAAERAVSADDELAYVHEYEHVTLARVLLARYTAERGDSLGAAIGLLERLLSAAESGGRIGTAIEVLVLLALARQADGDTPGGLVPLHRALHLAEPEGYVRVFTGEGTPMAALLKAAKGQHQAPAFLHRLHTASRRTAPPGSVKPVQAGPHGRLAEVIIEPLSDRELEVLRLLSTDLDGPGIARHLVLSLNTVRSHTKSIYAKLGVNSRRAAITRAVELGILTRPR